MHALQTAFYCLLKYANSAGELDSLSVTLFNDSYSLPWGSLLDSELSTKTGHKPKNMSSLKDKQLSTNLYNFQFQL
jgi:hypothetical protein